MKKCKMILAVVLCALMLFPYCITSFGADSVAYPESEHDYQNSFYGEWSYTHPTQVNGMYVTFSQDTATEAGENYSVILEYVDEVDLAEIIEYGNNYKNGDYISVFDGNNNLIDVYQGKELAGETIYIPGSVFKISLTSDSQLTDYGFKVTNVSDTPPQDISVLRVHLENSEIIKCFNKYAYEVQVDIMLREYIYTIVNGEAIISFSDSEDRNSSINELDISSPGMYDLYAVTTPVILQPEDVYSFRNGAEKFDELGKGSYYMSKEDYIRLVSSACIVNGAGPLALPAALTGVVLATYPDWTYTGSCIGFTSTVCLQKLGILDVVGTQKDADCMSDLKLTPELVSLLNYYNGQSFTSGLVKNIALKSQPEEYSRQLRELFTSAEQGNLVLLEFALGDGLLDDFHGLAVSGAYTNRNGEHVLLCYDSNEPEYATKGKCTLCYISPDFTIIDTGYDEGFGFSWTDDFECYRSLDIHKIESPHYYQFEIIKHIFEVLTQWFEVYIIGLFD